MKLKLDSDGNAVIQDGMPVYTYEDGTEQPFDAVSTISNFENKISNLMDEKDRHFNAKKKVEDKLKEYGKIDPKTAMDNASTVKKLKGQKLVDEHGLERYQKEWTEEITTAINEERDVERNQWQSERDDFEKKINNFETIVNKLAITDRFAHHPYFSGESPKTFYKPDHAAKIFGDRFKAEIKGSDVKVFAVGKDGKPMLSKKNHGEPAKFDEAVEMIVQSEAEHHDMFRSGPARRGPNIIGNLDGSHVDGESTAGRDKIRSGLKKYFRNAP